MGTLGHFTYLSPCQVVLVVKNPPANAGDIRGAGLIPGLGRSPGGGYGNPLQCSCLENPRDRGAWWAAIYGLAQSRTQLKWLSSSIRITNKSHAYRRRHNLRGSMGWSQRREMVLSAFLGRLCTESTHGIIYTFAFKMQMCDTSKEIWISSLENNSNSSLIPV